MTKVQKKLTASQQKKLDEKKKLIRLLKLGGVGFIAALGTGAMMTPITAAWVRNYPGIITEAQYTKWAKYIEKKLPKK